MASPKLRRVLTLLPKLISEGHRIAIVSKWSPILRILALCLTQRKITFVRIDDAVRMRMSYHQMTLEEREHVNRQLEAAR